MRPRRSTHPLMPADAGIQSLPQTRKALDSRSLLRQSEAALASRRRVRGNERSAWFAPCISILFGFQTALANASPPVFFAAPGRPSSFFRPRKQGGGGVDPRKNARGWRAEQARQVVNSASSF